MDLRIIMVILGILIVLAGAIPFLSSINLLSEKIPASGPVYSVIIIAIGAFGLIYALINVTMMGFSKFVTISLGLITILGGIVPFAASFLPEFIPTTYPVYNLMIILIGLIGIVYGMISIG